jgi:hypothetical protein
MLLLLFACQALTQEVTDRRRMLPEAGIPGLFLLVSGFTASFLDATQSTPDICVDVMIYFN